MPHNLSHRTLGLELLLLTCALMPLHSHGTDKPNVLFLLTDDQRADTIAALGNPHIKTQT